MPNYGFWAHALHLTQFLGTRVTPDTVFGHTRYTWHSFRAKTIVTCHISAKQCVKTSFLLWIASIFCILEYHVVTLSLVALFKNCLIIIISTSKYFDALYKLL